MSRATAPSAAFINLSPLDLHHPGHHAPDMILGSQKQKGAVGLTCPWRLFLWMEEDVAKRNTVLSV